MPAGEPSSVVNGGQCVRVKDPRPAERSRVQDAVLGMQPSKAARVGVVWRVGFARLLQCIYKIIVIKVMIFVYKCNIMNFGFFNPPRGYAVLTQKIPQPLLHASTDLDTRKYRALCKARHRWLGQAV